MVKEKSFTQSKKFVFALIGVLILAGLGITAFLTQSIGIALTPVLMSVIIVIGFIVVGVVLGQAYIDKYIRAAEIAAGKLAGKGEETDGKDNPE